MLRFALPILLLSSFSATAQVVMPATTKADLQHLQRLAQRESDPGKLVSATQGRYPTALIQGRCMIGFLGKLMAGSSPSVIQEEAVTVGAIVGDIVSLRIDAHHLDRASQLQGIAYLELAGSAAPTLDKLVKSIHADSVQRGINLPQSYTGRNVLIGITDWGFDYTHPMFYDTAMTQYRVRAAWDQYRQVGPAPAGFGYGTAYTTPTELIAAGSDTANIYSFATHGTHVMGIAGGGGAGTVYRGVAFDAHYLFTTFLIDAAAALDGFAWMKSVADQDGQRLVINMSWGLYYMGTLDGHSLISQAIDLLSQQGVVFVNSGGNNGDINFHIRKDFVGDTLHSRVQFYPYSANPNMWGQSITVWGDVGGSFSAGFDVTGNTNVALQQSPWYHTATQPAYLDSSIVVGTDTFAFNLTSEAAHPLNGRPYMRLRVRNTTTQRRIALKATATTGRVHFWNVTELTTGVGNWGQEFQAAGTGGWTNGNALYGISEPACTNSLISVAAYDSETISPTGTVLGGAIAAFSSTGPTLDERVKPDIAAPGVNVGSSISSFSDNSFTPFAMIDFQGRSYPFARFSGTSMAAPAVTGVVAMLLEADPTLTPAEVKDIIMTTARTDNNTGVIAPGGSTRWGMGKVNAYHAIAQALGVVGVEERTIAPLRAWPNPTADVLNITGTGMIHSYEVRDVTGRMIVSGGAVPGTLQTIDTNAWAAGTYLVRVKMDAQVHVLKVLHR